ncbi:hypothetical protein N9A94_00625 [Akkermansiaceae bacterium]|nr:hypothetical protein [Akkermansiaceae bacterium]MDA7888134.1 hypothetical protein [Akkermansiaceae bacterium]
MKRLKFRLFFSIFVFWAGNVSAYEVWIGTHLSTSEMATELPNWSNTTSQVEGFNVNRAPHNTDPASNNDYRAIFASFTNAENTMTEFARSQATRDPEKTDELAFPSIRTRLEEIFSLENSFGYELSILMFYDERGTFQGTEYLYEWTEIEIQYLRDWLDDNGHADVELMWNVRNNSVRNRELAAHPLVDSVEIEASTTALLANTNNQMTFFEWFWNNPATDEKRIAMQIPRVLPGDSLNQYEGTRRVAKLIGETIGYGEDGMRSDRLVFLPVTYNDNYPYLPETVSGGAAYTNTLASITLSLIEQRSLFEGRVRVPTNADADDTARHFAPTVTPIGDKVVPFETSTGPLAFSIDDDLTAPSVVMITGSSSNTNLIPSGNIVFAGSGTNRTVTVTPAAGQSGEAEIELWVSDGTLATPVTFSVTVLSSGVIPGTLYSLGADCSITEAPAIEKLNADTVDVGARGSAPWVERCTVFVFQLPDLGPGANPFNFAELNFNMVSKSENLRGYDLYGLGRRSGSLVLPSDFYSQSPDPDPSDATRVQQTIMNNSTPVGLVSTTAGGRANLRSYLNTQYAGGAGAGEYVFLRINTRAPKNGINSALLTMSEGEAAFRPRINYQAANPAPSITSISDQVLSVNTSTSALPFAIEDEGTPASSLELTGTSNNTALIPNTGIIFGGSGANRTVTITPASGARGTAEITVQVSDGTYSAETVFTVTVEGIKELVAGWDTWDSATAPGATVTASGIVATATASGTGGNWTITDNVDDPGRGSSGDQTWGSFDGNGAGASTVTNVGPANMSLTNGRTDGEVTLTITNNGPVDWELEAFHMDAVAFRRNAARTYALNVLAGSAITVGNVFTSGLPANDNGTDAITTLDGNLGTSHDVHDDLDISLAGLIDHTLAPGEVAIIQIAFSNGTGSGGGHHLFLDNVAVSGVSSGFTGLQSWRIAHFGTIENAGIAADDFDANGDGESNLLEFATGQNPHAKTLLASNFLVLENSIKFQYPRSKSASADGFVFRVEWSDTLEIGSWDDAGVSELLLGDNGSIETLEATISLGDLARRFVRLKFAQP